MQGSWFTCYMLLLLFWTCCLHYTRPDMIYSIWYGCTTHIILIVRLVPTMLLIRHHPANIINSVSMQCMIVVVFVRLTLKWSPFWPVIMTTWKWFSWMDLASWSVMYTTTIDTSPRAIYIWLKFQLHLIPFRMPVSTDKVNSFLENQRQSLNDQGLSPGAVDQLVMPAFTLSHTTWVNFANENYLLSHAELPVSVMARLPQKVRYWWCPKLYWIDNIWVNTQFVEGVPKIISSLIDSLHKINHVSVPESAMLHVVLLSNPA